MSGKSAFDIANRFTKKISEYLTTKSDTGVSLSFFRGNTSDSPSNVQLCAQL